MGTGQFDIFELLKSSSGKGSFGQLVNSMFDFIGVPHEEKDEFLRSLDTNLAVPELPSQEPLEKIEQLEEFVWLMSIEDPFERWEELAKLVGNDWPEGLTAAEAVAEGRR